MRVRLLVDKTGGRYDGQSWPRRGGEFDVPAEEGEALVAQGDAEEVTPPPPRSTRPRSSPASSAPAKADTGG
jgi:hypothetical protein